MTFLHKFLSNHHLEIISNCSQISLEIKMYKIDLRTSFFYLSTFSKSLKSIDVSNMPFKFTIKVIRYGRFVRT